MIEVLIAATVAITFIVSQTYAEDIKTVVNRPPTTPTHPEPKVDDGDKHLASESDFLSNWVADGSQSTGNLTGYSTGEDKR